MMTLFWIVFLQIVLEGYYFDNFFKVDIILVKIP